MRVAQRPERKNQRDQQSVKRADGEARVVHSHDDGQFDDALQRRAGEIGNRRAYP